MGSELGAIIRPDVIGDASLNHKISKDGKNALAVEPSRHVDGQALPYELIDHCKHTELTPVPCPILDKVISPDVARSLRPKPHARSVVQPQPPPFWLLLRHAKALPPPDPSDTLVVHMPAIPSEQSRDPPIAVATIPACQLDDGRGQDVFIIELLRLPPLR